MPVRPALDLLEGEQTRFRWILADPPYDAPEIPWLLGRLGSGALLENGGGLVLEARTSVTAPERSGVLRRTRDRKIGDTILLFYVAGPAGEVRPGGGD
jgi:16S rRNA G966 N2-methylase RsmD